VIEIADIRSFDRSGVPACAWSLHKGTTMAITRINEFHAANGKADALHAFLASVIGLIRDAEGCRSVELLVGQDDPAHLAIVEVWASVESHQAAASRVPAAKLTEVQPLLAEPPKGRYYHNDGYDAPR